MTGFRTIPLAVAAALLSALLALPMVNAQAAMGSAPARGLRAISPDLTCSVDVRYMLPGPTSRSDQTTIYTTYQEPANPGQTVTVSGPKVKFRVTVRAQNGLIILPYTHSVPVKLGVDADGARLVSRDLTISPPIESGAPEKESPPVDFELGPGRHNVAVSALIMVPNNRSANPPGSGSTGCSIVRFTVIVEDPAATRQARARRAMVVPSLTCAIDVQYRTPAGEMRSLSPNETLQLGATGASSFAAYVRVDNALNIDYTHAIPVQVRLWGPNNITAATAEKTLDPPIPASSSKTTISMAFTSTAGSWRVRTDIRVPGARAANPAGWVSCPDLPFSLVSAQTTQPPAPPSGAAGGFANQLYPMISSTRCANCHGRVSPASAPHPLVGLAAVCASCHGFPTWSLASFPFWGGSGPRPYQQICSGLAASPASSPSAGVPHAGDNYFGTLWQPGLSFRSYDNSAAPGTMSDFQNNWRTWVGQGKACP